MRNNKGFLLLEVIVSIVIITGGLLFVTRAYSTSKKAIERSRDLFKYSLLLEEKMFDFEEKGGAELGVRKEAFKDYRNCFWSVDIKEAFAEDPGLKDLNLLILDVSEKEDLSDRYSLQTYLKNKK